MLSIKNLSVAVQGQVPDPRRPHPGSSGRRGSRRDGAERGGQVDPVLRPGRASGLRGHGGFGGAGRRRPARPCARRPGGARRLPLLPVSDRDSGRAGADLPARRPERPAPRPRRGRSLRPRLPAPGPRQGGGPEGGLRSCCAKRRSTSASPAARRSGWKFFRWLCFRRDWPSSTKPIPAWTSTPCESSPRGWRPCARRTGSLLIITHYQRLLDHIRPDRVHVLAGGRIVASGGPDLALDLEREGYDKYAGLQGGGLEASPMKSGARHRDRRSGPAAVAPPGGLALDRPARPGA